MYGLKTLTELQRLPMMRQYCCSLQAEALCRGLETKYFPSCLGKSRKLTRQKATNFLLRHSKYQELGIEESADCTSIHLADLDSDVTKHSTGTMNNCSEAPFTKKSLFAAQVFIALDVETVLQPLGTCTEIDHGISLAACIFYLTRVTAEQTNALAYSSSQWGSRVTSDWKIVIYIYFLVLDPTGKVLVL